jgi:hypothetical protein
MVEAPVSDRPNIHSNRPQRRLSVLNMYVFWAFKIARIGHPKKRQDRGSRPFRSGDLDAFFGVNA